MSVSDYGAVLRVNGHVVNTDDFMKESNLGYSLEVAQYKDKEIKVKGNYFVMAGDKDLLLCFYKGDMIVIQNEVVTNVISWSPFKNETLLLDEAEIEVSHLDENLYLRDRYYNLNDMSDWLTQIGFTDRDRLFSRAFHCRLYRKCLRKLRKVRKKSYTRTSRWIANWQYKGDTYECIFGVGITTDDSYKEPYYYETFEFTEVELAILNDWLENK